MSRRSANSSAPGRVSLHLGPLAGPGAGPTRSRQRFRRSSTGARPGEGPAAAAASAPDSSAAPPEWPADQPGPPAGAHAAGIGPPESPPDQAEVPAQPPTLVRAAAEALDQASEAAPEQLPRGRSDAVIEPSPSPDDPLPPTLLLEEAARSADEASRAAPAAPPARPVVAVLALAPRCGATTLALWLAAALASRDPDGVGIVSTPAPRGAAALRTPAAVRTARALAVRGLEPVRTTGRLCLLEASHSPLSIAATYLGPLVIDVGHGATADAALSVADHVLLVASPAVEPALAEVVAQRVAGDGPDPIVVLNRAVEAERWDGRADVVLPESRLAARRATAGREPRGAIGTLIARLADELESSLWQ
jgi:hypothetical protein